MSNAALLWEGFYPDEPRPDPLREVSDLDYLEKQADDGRVEIKMGNRTLRRARVVLDDKREMHVEEATLDKLGGVSWRSAQEHSDDEDSYAPTSVSETERRILSWALRSVVGVSVLGKAKR